jgi:hypothetical protein
MSGGLEPITLWDAAQVQKHQTFETWANVVKRGTKHEIKSNPLVTDKHPKRTCDTIMHTQMAESKQNPNSKSVYTPRYTTTNANLLVEDEPSRSPVPLNVTLDKARNMTEKQRHFWRKPFSDNEFKSYPREKGASDKHPNKGVTEFKRNPNSNPVYTPRATTTYANLLVKDEPLPSRSPVPLNVTLAEARNMTEKQRHFWRVAFTDEELKGNPGKKK